MNFKMNLDTSISLISICVCIDILYIFLCEASKSFPHDITRQHILENKVYNARKRLSVLELLASKVP